MTQPIRAQESTQRPAPITPTELRAQEPKPLSSRIEADSFLSTPPTPEQILVMEQAIAALDALPPTPKGVLEKRSWLQSTARVRQDAQRAAYALGNAAFFHNAYPKARADAASDKFHALHERVNRMEEQAGLRQPLPPRDPDRPKGSWSKANEKLLNSRYGGSLGLLLAPAALLFDGADALGRPAERAHYPEAMKEYQRRLGEYEKARRDFPL
ncbi:MAG: hypothetical protein VKP62_14715 [Candidatus Sericytochromatia bacterium]|nr:hypothetical protein [Candidatus Sericytochromatia bacterium]